MDCRWCGGWCLCRACLPICRAQPSSIWSMVVTLPLYMLQSTGTTSKSQANNTACSRNVFSGTPHERAATAVISEFCENLANGCCPAESELAGLLAKCNLLSPWAVAVALCEQLSWTTDVRWPPKLRALHAIHYITERAETGQELVDFIAEQAGPALQKLSVVPQLRMVAASVICSLEEHSTLLFMGVQDQSDVYDHPTCGMARCSQPCLVEKRQVKVRMACESWCGVHQVSPVQIPCNQGASTTKSCSCPL